MNKSDNQKGTAYFLFLLCFSSFPNPRMNGLSLGLHPLAYALDNSSSLQSTGNSGSALDWTLNNSSRSDNWTPEAWNWKFQTLPRFELPPPFYTIFTHLLSHSDDRY